MDLRGDLAPGHERHTGEGILAGSLDGTRAPRITLAPAGKAEFLRHADSLSAAFFAPPSDRIVVNGSVKCSSAENRVRGVTLYNQSALSFRPPFGAAPSDRARATTVIVALFPEVNAAALVQAALGAVTAERESAATASGFASGSAIFWPSEASLHALDAARGRAARARARAAIFDGVPGDWVGGDPWPRDAVFGLEGARDDDVEAEHQKWLKEAAHQLPGALARHRRLTFVRRANSRGAQSGLS